MATLKRNLFIAFGFSLLILIISSIASYTSIVNLLKSSGQVAHTHDVMNAMEGVLSELKDAETGQRGYLLSGEAKFLAPYNGASARAQTNITRIQELTKDSEIQQKDAAILRVAVIERINSLQHLIDLKRNGVTITAANLAEGQDQMEEARNIIKRMENRESTLLRIRTAMLNRFSNYTPVLIVVAALLSIIITVFFYIRLRRDFEHRIHLQHALEEKDKEITRRINIIQDVSSKISAGDYSVRVEDKSEDKLGSVATGLNKMAESLKNSFEQLSDKEWLQAGVAQLNEKMLGEKSIEELASIILEFVVVYSRSQAGAIYVRESEHSFFLADSYALSEKFRRRVINSGEGIAGQAAKDKRQIILEDIPEELHFISFTTGEVRPRAVAAIPIFFNNRVKAVIELASIEKYTNNELAFFEAVSHNTGIVLNTAENLKRLQELLEQTQSQAEELQAQHSELENLNTELEAQAQKLQASEEELKVQQEELLQTNQELEEKTRSLEEKNQLVIERNFEIQKKASELALTTKYKSEFLANMSHELRTPLNSILLLSRLLHENNEKNLTPDQVEYAQVIQSSGNGLLSLIDEILDLSKIEAGRMELEYGKVKVDDIVQNMRSLFTPVANEKKISFNISIGKNIPEFIETDKMRVEQILKNLLSNAFKFTARGSVDLDVEDRPDKNSFIAITVKDTGIGIQKEKQQLIFEAFQQADGTTRRKFGGTGLGLSISRELAKLLGGEIRISSEPEKGSSFTVYIPKQKLTHAGEKLTSTIEIRQQEIAELDPDPLKEDEDKKERKKYITTVIPENIADDRDHIEETDKCILIIEDDTLFSKALLDFTRKKGYKGIVAVTGDQGIELAKHFKPVGILLDLQLPVKDGWEVMEELKNNTKTKHIPVHMMSSYQVKKESLTKGAVDFISKPVAFEQMQEIFAKLEKVLDKKHKKVLIVEENTKHAKALAYFLEGYDVSTQISNSVQNSLEALTKDGVDCVILDMGIPDQRAYETLETMKKNPGFENLPIIIFTGKNLSKKEEQHIKQYADSIVIKTAYSYQRILDEVSLFLHLMEEHHRPQQGSSGYMKLGSIDEVLGNKTIMIVDDDVRNIFSLTRALEDHKMNVISAMDGKDALRLLDANPGTDIVLMDIMMPVMDGYESMHRIRAQKKFKNLPIIAVTAKAMTGDREKCIQAGASDYISKPVDIDQLISLLRVWLYEKGI